MQNKKKSFVAKIPKLSTVFIKTLLFKKDKILFQTKV